VADNPEVFDPNRISPIASSSTRAAESRKPEMNFSVTLRVKQSWSKPTGSTQLFF
jgi:hypothetical protein